MPAKKIPATGLAARLKELNWTGQRVHDWKKRPEILLHPNIPKPLHGVNPRTVLGQSWWNTVRQAAYVSTDYHCITCGVHKTSARYFKHLEGHEVYDIDYARGRMVYVETVPLCHACHNFIHSGRMENLVSQGKMSALKQHSILQHGSRVLHNAGIKPKTPYNGPFPPWSAWRLVVEGQEFPPVFKDEIDWMRHHGHLEE